MKEEQYIDILKAYIDNKTIEYREKGHEDCSFKPIYRWDFSKYEYRWNFSKYEYRIKSGPKEIWMIKGGKHIFNSQKDIIDHCCFSNTPMTEIIHFKEVI